ncbi:MAG: YdcH family protein, partial [Steroidobacteraceae bacterium]
CDRAEADSILRGADALVHMGAIPGPMNRGTTAYDDRELFRNIEKLRQLRIEHRDLDEVIARLSMDIHVDEIQLKRLKRRKLMLKDQIERYGSHLIPDLNA